MPRYIVNRSRDVRILETLEFEADDDAAAVVKGRQLADEIVISSDEWETQSVDPMDDDDEHVVITTNTGDSISDNYTEDAN